MVRIRLMRMGMKGQPSYRVVVADIRSPRDGRFIENIGWYNPLTDPSTIKIDAERAQYWLGVGAQPSTAVQSLLKRAGIPRHKAAGTAQAGSGTAKAQTGTRSGEQTVTKSQAKARAESAEPAAATDGAESAESVASGEPAANER
jgi:small subunit ribosomal protein S16